MNEDKIIQKLLEHDSHLQCIKEQMATKNDVRLLMSTLDSLQFICKKIQEDHFFTIEWLKRLQKQVDRV